MKIGEVITDIRKRRGLTQDDIAARLYVTRQAVSRWENGDTVPGVEIMRLISKEFDVPASVLLDLPGQAECQSCGMRLTKIDDFGSDADGSVHKDYCKYCMNKGAFTNDRTIDEMIESNLRFLDEYNAETGLSFTPEQARIELKQHLSTLKRWK